MRKLKKRIKKSIIKTVHAFGVFLMVFQTLAAPVSYGAFLAPTAVASDIVENAISQNETAVSAPEVEIKDLVSVEEAEEENATDFSPAQEPAEEETHTNNASNEANSETTSNQKDSDETSASVVDEKGELGVYVAPQVDADSLDLEIVDPENLERTASLATDKADYAPTDTAIITGADFIPGQTYTLIIFSDDEPPTRTEVEITTDEEGQFIYTYQLDGTYRPNYTVIVSNKTGQELARTTFTDAPPAANLDQVRNGSATSPISPANWVNGNAGASNAHYVEGYSIPYRAVLTNLPTGTPITITFGYDIKHSNKHAIDYLTSYNRINDPEHNIVFGHGPETIDPTIGVSGVTLGSDPSNTYPIPAPSSVGSSVPNQPTDSFNALLSSEREMSIWNGTISNIIYVSQGDLTANQAETRISVTFTATSPTVVLAWGGHIASRNDWKFDPSGEPRSAGGISGSPYHMRLISWTINNLGNQDRSLSAVAVYTPPAKITIIKDTEPNSAQDFNFTTTGGLTPSTFSLDDDEDGTLSNTQVFTGVGPGTYTITEGANPPGYSLTNITCEGGIYSIGTRSVTLTITGGEDVTCTFTNALQQGTLIINKVAVGGDATFDYTVSGPTNLTPSITTINGAGTTGSLSVNAGTNYAITETVPSGWDFTSAVCDKTYTTGTNGVTNVTVNAGQTTTCTFTNTKRGHLIVQKTTYPSSDQTVFTINASGTGTIIGGGAGTVTDATDKDYEVTPGTYSVTETVPVGWDKTDDTCQNVVVNAGETKYCLLTNTKRGKIIVDKVTVPSGDSQSFEFDPSWSATNFSLKDGEQNDSGWLAPGTYSVSEIVPEG